MITFVMCFTELESATVVSTYGVIVICTPPHLVGGQGGSSKVEAFDPQAGAWAEVAPMPTGRASPAAAVVGGRLYAIGGFGGGNDLSTVEAFDPQTDAWAALARPDGGVRP